MLVGSRSVSGAIVRRRVPRQRDDDASERAQAADRSKAPSLLTSLSLSLSRVRRRGCPRGEVAMRRSAERNRAEFGWLRVRASHGGASPVRTASSASSGRYLRIERARARARTHSGTLEPRDPLALSAVHAQLDAPSE